MAKRRIVLGEDIRPAAVSAAAVMNDGGVVVFPTETVYGIGVVSGDAAALEKLRELKGRSAAKPFQYLTADVEMAEAMGAVFSARAARLARNFWPGPLTLVVPDGTDSDGTLGIRVPDSAFVRALCRELGRAVVSSSANHPGSCAPVDANAADVFGGDVDLLVDGGPAAGVASTVVRCFAEGFEILRMGGVSGEAIRSAWDG